MRFQVLGGIGPERLSRLIALLPGHTFALWPDEVPQPDALLVWDLDLAQVAGLLDRQPGVRWLAMRWAGVSPALLALLLAHPRVVLTNGSGAHGPAVAEYVLGALLAHYKRFFEIRAFQARKEWVSPFRLDELRPRTVGIVGMGDLGTSIARALRPHVSRLLGLRRGSGSVDLVDATYPIADLHTVLPQLQALVLAAPLTPETRGLIGARELALLPAGAFLVNVGRGPLVATDALVEALRSGYLAGAALDVFDEEPLPPESPLWDLPNVYLSPHCADHTRETRDRALDLLVDNVRRFAAGEPLRNVVDPALGY